MLVTNLSTELEVCHDDGNLRTWDDDDDEDDEEKSKQVVELVLPDRLPQTNDQSLLTTITKISIYCQKHGTYVHHCKPKEMHLCRGYMWNKIISTFVDVRFEGP